MKKLQFKGTVKSIQGDVHMFDRTFDNVADYNGFISMLMTHGIQFEASTEVVEELAESKEKITLPYYYAILDGTLEDLLDEYSVDDFSAELTAQLDPQLKIISTMSEDEKCEAFDEVDDALAVLNPQEGNDLIETFDQTDNPSMQYKFYALVNFYHTLRFALA